MDLLNKNELNEGYIWVTNYGDRLDVCPSTWTALGTALEIQEAPARARERGACALLRAF